MWPNGIDCDDWKFLESMGLKYISLVGLIMCRIHCVHMIGRLNSLHH